MTYRRTSGDGGHAGLAWREGKALVVLSQRGHLELTLDEKPHERDAVVQVALPRSRVEPTIRYARRVYKVNGKSVPYNFAYPNAIFSRDTGELLLRRGEGLTCSTFVIALLEAAGVTLLKRDEWPRREADEKRHRDLAEVRRKAYLAEGGGTFTPEAIEHMAYMNVQVKAQRFRPEETAAAASVHPPPASFEASVNAAAELMAAYDAHFAAAPPATL